MSEKNVKDQIKESIRSMNVVDLAELVKELEDEFGVSATPMMGAMPLTATAEVTDKKEEEVTEFDVILKDCGTSKIPVIKEVRAVTSLGLKEAKELVEAGDKAVKEKLSKKDAEELKGKLEKAGAVVELVPSK